MKLRSAFVQNAHTLHAIEEGSGRTLCGKPASKIEVDRLFHTSRKGRLCKVCVYLANREE